MQQRIASAFGATALFAAAIAPVSTAQADNTARTTLSVSGRIVAPLELTPTVADWRIDDVAAARADMSRVELNCEAQYACGTVVVLGEPGFSYAITVAEATTDLAGVDFSPRCTTAAGRAFGVIGADPTIICGGEIWVAPNAIGNYRATFVVSVAYD